ncbi:GST-like protein [Paracoccus isoporae]|uniref:GST-like protein n=1 Tax=Paracoccus isoporae TaxID=591205 RepID=A0A1G6ZKM2_9RHOB|nr:glutathione S-transferase N-terminal domain-containing protein [Paracoccus isoporae]SDE03061.1 GST-like protein [Paracoccus isoporae]
MIDFYYGPTSNGRKIAIMLEETGLDYRVRFIDILNGDQFDPAFLKISPNNKQPAILDHDGPGGRALAMFESGAILIYLAEKTGLLMPTDPQRRYHCLQWLMFQMSGIGPMFGQLHHFNHYARDKIPYAIERYRNEADRLRRVLNAQLTGRQFIVDEYSIADIACYPYVKGFRDRYPTPFDASAIDRWLDRMEARPAVLSGFNLRSADVRPEVRGEKPLDQHSWDALYGRLQHKPR